MLIEVCGVDGSGKSTLIDGVRRQLRESGTVQAYERTVRSESRNLLEAVCLEEQSNVFRAQDLELAVLLDALAQSGSFTHYRGSSVSHALVTGYRCTLAARLDERGFGTDRGLTGLVARVPPADLLVLLQVPVKVALERLDCRLKGDALLNTADPSARIGARQRVLTSHATSLGAVVLDGTGTQRALVEEVVSLITDDQSSAGTHIRSHAQ